MGIIRGKTISLVLGFTLILFTIPLVLGLNNDQFFSRGDQTSVMEFTDVRIVTLDLTIVDTKTPLVRRVTIHSDFTSPPPWCLGYVTDAALCPYSIGGEDMEQSTAPLVSHWGMPLL